MKKARIIATLCAVCFLLSPLQALANTASHQITIRVQAYSSVSMQDDANISIAMGDGESRTAQVQRDLRYGGVVSSTSKRCISVQLAGSGTRSVPDGLSVRLSANADLRQPEGDREEITLSGTSRTLMTGLGSNNASTGPSIRLNYTIDVADDMQLDSKAAEAACVCFTLTDV